MWRAKRPALALVGFVLLAGCSGSGGPRFNPVEGKVLWRGKPAAGARVVFHPVSETPNQQLPSAQVEEDGSFHLKTPVPGRGRGNAADGAPSGEYRVTIDWLISVGSAKSGADKLGRRYADPKISSLLVTVKEGKNVVPPFELK